MLEYLYYLTLPKRCKTITKYSTATCDTNYCSICRNSFQSSQYFESIETIATVIALFLTGRRV